MSNVGRGTSPSKSVDKAAQTSWTGGAPKSTQSPQEAIKNSPTKNPIEPSSIK